MSHTILFSTYGARGDVFPYIAIGQELVRRGHRAILATAVECRGAAESAGLEFRPVRPNNPHGEAALRVMAPRDGTEYLFRRLLLPAIRDSVYDLREAVHDVDLLVSHTTSLAGPIVSELEAERGLRWASGVVSPLALFSSRDTPALPVAPHIAEVRPGLNRVLVRILRRQFGMFLKPVKEVRQELGLPPGTNALFDDAHSPLLGLGLFSPSLAPTQPDWPTGFKATGFCFVDFEEEMPAEVQRFLNEGPPPIVFVLASYYQDQQGWQHAAEAALQELGQRGLFLGLPHSQSRNSLSVPFAPLDKILPHTQVLVHQGGIGTLAQGLKHGVPMVIAPLSHDQPDTARLARRVGVAQIIVPKCFDRRTLQSTLATVLADQDMHNNLAQWKELILHENGAAAAADELEALLA